LSIKTVPPENSSRGVNPRTIYRRLLLTMGLKITNVGAREIVDCRGFPTVEVDIWIDGTMAGSAGGARAHNKP
jgi:hypothetical protein